MTVKPFSSGYGRCWTTRDKERGPVTGAISDAAPCFCMAELTVSSTAQREGLDNTPNAAERARLQKFAELVLQPIRDIFGPIKVNSGFRSEAVNNAVGGSRTSEHRLANAGDIQTVETTGPQGFTNKEMATYLYSIRNTFPLDQVIWYEDTTHVHIGRILSSGNQVRRQFLRAYRDAAGKRKYATWKPTSDEIARVTAKIEAMPHRQGPLEDPRILPRP